jgi:tetratricopeptide (TPR) repeat protein
VTPSPPNGCPHNFLELRPSSGSRAEKLGDISDQLKWVLDIGYVYLDSRDFAAAERSYRQSLDLAEKLKGRGDIINALQAMAFVSEQTNKLDEAKRYADEALAKAREDKNGRDQVYPRLVQGRRRPGRTFVGFPSSRRSQRGRSPVGGE